MDIWISPILVLLIRRLTYQLPRKYSLELISHKLHFMYLFVNLKSTWKIVLELLSREIVCQLYKEDSQICYCNTFDWRVSKFMLCFA